MAFNDQGNGKSPWDSNKDQPPDLDQIVDEWQSVSINSLAVSQEVGIFEKVLLYLY